MHTYADELLKPDKLTYLEVAEQKNKKEMLAAAKEEAIHKLG